MSDESVVIVDPVVTTEPVPAPPPKLTELERAQLAEVFFKLQLAEQTAQLQVGAAKAMYQRISLALATKYGIDLARDNVNLDTGEIQLVAKG